MNILKLRRLKARMKQLNIKGENLRPSKNKDKKYAVDVDGKTVHFGHKNYKDYLDHNDPKRRANYRKRHAGIIQKDGTRAIDDKNSPAYFSYHLLW